MEKLEFVCSHCGTPYEKREGNFYKNILNSTGYTYWCIPCVRNGVDEKKAQAKKEKKDAEIYLMKLKKEGKLNGNMLSDDYADDIQQKIQNYSNKLSFERKTPSKDWMKSDERNYLKVTRLTKKNEEVMTKRIANIEEIRESVKNIKLPKTFTLSESEEITDVESFIESNLQLLSVERLIYRHRPYYNRLKKVLDSLSVEIKVEEIS